MQQARPSPPLLRSQRGANRRFLFSWRSPDRRRGTCAPRGRGDSVEALSTTTVRVPHANSLLRQVVVYCRQFGKPVPHNSALPRTRKGGPFATSTPTGLDVADDGERMRDGHRSRARYQWIPCVSCAKAICSALSGCASPGFLPAAAGESGNMLNAVLSRIWVSLGATAWLTAPKI